MTVATATLPVPVGVGSRLLGEVIAWACPGMSITHSALVAALEATGLDAGVARELAPPRLQPRVQAAQRAAHHPPGE